MHSENVIGSTFAGSELLVGKTFLVELGQKSQVPFVSFSNLGPTIFPTQNPQNFSSSVKAIAAILQEFEWSEVVLIYEDTEYGNGIIPYLVGVFQDIGIRLGHISAISNSAEDFEILRELNTLTTMQTRVFIVHMSTPKLGSRIFVLAYKAGMLSKDYAWLITDGLSNSLDVMDPRAIDLMEGVLGIRPHIPKSKDLENFKKRWNKNLHLMKQNSLASDQVSIFGLWAYDTIYLLSMATEKIGLMNTSFFKANYSGNSIDLANLGVSQIGPKLVNEILGTKIKGLSGEFHLFNGQLQPSAFEIFNMIGTGERVVGYWTLEKGLSRNLGSNKGPRNKLKKILWPGDSITIPKGWAVPELKVAIPKKMGFTQFVEIHSNPHTNETKCLGFSCDVFFAVLETLDFPVPYKFIPFINENGESAGTYNDLLYQLKEKKVDLVVGDMTIVANRTSYVEFTLPYSESGVIMLVPIKRDKRKNLWIFVQPWHWDLWLAFISTLIFIGFVILIMEMKPQTTNTTFQGPLRRQLSMIFYFPFSSVVLPQRESMVRDCTRFVLAIWLILTIILMQSYTASLSTMLTIEELRPTFVSVNELRRKGCFVGYQNGSFVKDLLVHQLMLNASKLKPYDTVLDYYKALSEGSENGGVSAIFDEIPYIRVFLAKYGNKYMMTGPTHRTDGFGFAFPLESRLVSHFSRAILRVRENKTMDDIEKRYFGHELTSQSHADPIDTSSPSLGLYSFGGLFIITGVVTILALIVSESYIWRTVRTVRECSQRCLSSKEPNNTKEAAVEPTTENEMNAIKQSPVQEIENSEKAIASTSNQIEENISPQQEIIEENN
ncbi:hypothetical protein Patl1_14368 [Pistacia atlantica]|uniref:Uncharacterized protein n=1 Tax=Pistacia atlantica TaxID=434234 RepID=A0ACC1AWG0_9ROSI|nr:hypothetical protein Patl1_14368 [Pistacia atlantica]